MTATAVRDRNRAGTGRSAGRGPRTRSAVVVGALVAALLAGVVVSALVGQLDVSTRAVVGTVLDGVGVRTPWRPDEDLVVDALWYVRFPRVAMCVVVGAALAVAGAMMQAVFGNPLAEPGVVGVSAGAALGAAVAIATGITVGGGWAMALLAFLGGLAATIFVYTTARSAGRTEVVTLLLTGIAVNAFAGAGLALVLFAGDTGSREQIVFWQLGSMNGSRWSEVLVVTVVTVPGVLFALAVARRYDLLALGERSASHLGVRVERLRIVSIAVMALLTGVAVAFTGIIAFVGLVVPHALRMVLGPAHRGLLLGSVLAGAVLLVWADVLARTLVTGADLPIGLLTSVIGGPFFLHLVRRARTRAGGWA